MYIYIYTIIYVCVLRPRPRLYHHCMSQCSLSAEHEFLKQFINALDFVCRHESTWSQSLRGCCTTTTASRVPVVFEPTRNASMQCPTRALCHQQRLDKGACKMLRCFPTFFQLQDLKSQSRLIFQGSSAPVICHDMSVIIIHHNLTLLGLAGLPMFSGAKPRFRSMGLKSVWWLLTRFRFKSFKRRTRWTWAQEWQLSDFLITGSSGPLAILIDGKKKSAQIEGSIYKSTRFTRFAGSVSSENRILSVQHKVHRVQHVYKDAKRCTKMQSLPQTLRDLCCCALLVPLTVTYMTILYHVVASSTNVTCATVNETMSILKVFLIFQYFK